MYSAVYSYTKLISSIFLLCVVLFLLKKMFVVLNKLFNFFFSPQHVMSFEEN